MHVCEQVYCTRFAWPAWLRAVVGGVALLLVVPAARAQADTAHAREIFASINARLPTLTAVRFVAPRTDVDYKTQTRAWLDAGAVRKIENTAFDDSGNVITEYYFANGQLVFGLRTVTGFKGTGNASRMVATGEDRFYFRDAKMFKWLSGMGKERAEQAVNGADFAEEEKALQAESALLVKAALAAHARQAAAKPAR